jgi:hypothetical protein
MNGIPVRAKHVHLDIELDPRFRFHYRSQGQNARRTCLHRGDTLTFTCADGFSIRFIKESPFEATVLQSRKESMISVREWFATARVRDQANDGIYPYVVALTRDSRVFEDSPEGPPLLSDGPEIIIATEASV